MALVVDTNILFYAVNRGCPEYEFGLEFFRGLVATGDTCFVPENVSAHARTRNPAASEDKEFAKFSSLEVINPSRPDRI